MTDCYKNIFGLTTDDCDCLAEGRPDDYDESASSLYIGDLTEISSLVSIDNCDKDIWSILENARTLGLNQLVAESNALLTRKFTLKRQPAKNQILGKIKAKTVYDHSKNYALVRLACNPIRGGYFTLKNLGTIFQGASTFDVSLYNNVDGFIETIEVTTTANKYAKTSVNKQYPLFSKYVDCLEYYFVYEFDESNLAKDNSADCGCGRNEALEYDLSNPYFLRNKYTKAWTQFAMVGGTEINSLTELDDLPSSSTSNMLGLVLEIDFTCKVDEVLCSDSLDFEGNPLAMSLAFAAMYVSATHVARAVIKNTGLAPNIMADVDLWEDSLEEWQEKYNEHLTYIVDKASIEGNDCLTCRDIIGMTRQGLFA